MTKTNEQKSFPKKGKSNPKRRKRPVKRNSSNMQLPNDNISSDRIESNDPTWYMHNAALAESASAIPFSYALGKPLHIYDVNYRVPGVFGLQMVPAFGRAMTMTDPINIAAVKLYTYVRHQNSGHSNYDATDLMMYVLAMGQAYSFHEWLKRMYGYLNTYSVTNKYIPKAYAMTDSIDFDDMIKHLPNLQYYINELAVKLSAFAIPQDFDLFKRHRFLYTNIYTDDETSRSGLYMFTPDGFYQFDPTHSDTGSGLTYKALNRDQSYTFDQIVAYGNDLLATVFGDEDAGIMSGDILKAYGDASIYSPGAIEFDYSVLPIHDYSILQQIHNGTVFWGVEPGGVAQTSDGIIQNQQLLSNSNRYPNDTWTRVLLDTHSETPTSAEIFEMSRLSAIVRKVSGSTTKVSILGGSELISTAFIIKLTDSDTFQKLTLIGNVFNASDITDFRVISIQSDAISKFNMHPMIAYRDTVSHDLRIIGDVDNVTAISDNQLSNLHETALLSLYAVYA